MKVRYIDGDIIKSINEVTKIQPVEGLKMLIETVDKSTMISITKVVDITI
jgi:hypothetical protein